MLFSDSGPAPCYHVYVAVSPPFSEVTMNNSIDITIDIRNDGFLYIYDITDKGAGTGVVRN